MDIKTSLYISYAAIGISVLAFIFMLAAGPLGIHLSSGATGFVRMLSVIWPLGFYAAAVYRRKIAQDAKKQG